MQSRDKLVARLSSEADNYYTLQVWVPRHERWVNVDKFMFLNVAIDNLEKLKALIASGDFSI